MKAYRLSDIPDEDLKIPKVKRNCSYYLLRFVCSKLLTIIKECGKFFLSFRCLIDFTYTRLTNLHYFFLHNPPAVIFFINITFFVIILSIVTFSLTVSNNIKSPQEWRNFLESFSQLELCIIPFTLNTTFGNIDQPTLSSDLSILKRHNRPPIKHPTQNYRTHNIPIRLSIHPTIDFFTTPSKQFLLTTTMYGKYMGFKGSTSQTIINVSLSFQHIFNSSCPHDRTLIQMGCHVNNVLGCVSFTAPRDIFPENVHMNHCSSSFRKHPYSTALSPIYEAGLNWQLPDLDSLYYCRSRTIIKARFDDFLSKPQYHLNEVKVSTQRRLYKTTAILVLFLVIFLFVVALFPLSNRIRRFSENRFKDTLM